MEKRKKLLTEQEREKEWWIEKQEGIYLEMGKLKDGKEVRDYIKAHREDIKKYHIHVPFLCKYPRTPLVISILALLLSIIKLFM